MAQGRRERRPPKNRTVQYKDFTGGANLTDSRVAIKDTELAWLENYMPIGSGSLRGLRAPGDAIATLAQGISSLWGETISNSPYMYAIGNDGSLTQITPNGMQTVVGGANTVSAQAGDTHMTVWRGTTLLILDPVTGYSSWDGVTYTVIDATQKGTAIAVFQGRVWLINGRTITFTAPNTFSDFSVANGAGSTVLGDEAFPGNINAAVSAIEQLWLVGDGAVEIISNVVATGTSPNVVTTFSITNIVTNLGSNAQHSVIGYLRSLAFLAPFGGYALAGVTPQKITEKLDGLFPDLTVSHQSASSAVAVVNNILCLIFRVQYNGQLSVQGAGPVPLLLIFANGRWCFASQGTVTWTTSLLVNGQAQAWGTDGSKIYQLFGGLPSTPVKYRILGKLSDHGQATTVKRVNKTGFEFQSAYSVNPTMLVENETSATETQGLQTTVPVTFVNNAGQPVSFVNNLGQTVTFVAQGIVLSRQVSSMYGNYIGWRVENTGAGDPPYLIQAIQLDLEEGPKWVTPATTSG